MERIAVYMVIEHLIRADAVALRIILYAILLVNHFFYWMGCRDGRIKVVGGDNIEALLISPAALPFKNLEVCYYSH